MKKSVRKIKFFNRMIAIVLMLSLIIPSFNVLGVFDAVKSEVEVLASDVTDMPMIKGDFCDINVIADALAKQFHLISNTSALPDGTMSTEEDGSQTESVVPGKRDSFRFRINEDKPLYEALKNPLTFVHGDDSDEIDGVYLGDVKSNNNENKQLSLLEVGKVDDPYVILEIAPVATVSELRPHVANAGFYDYSYVELYGGKDINGDEVTPVALTENDEAPGKLSEKTTVRINLIQVMLDRYLAEILKVDATVYNEIIKYEEFLNKLDKNSTVQEKKDAFVKFIMDAKIAELEERALVAKKSRLDAEAHALANRIKTEAEAEAHRITQEGMKVASDLRDKANQDIAKAKEGADAQVQIYMRQAETIISKLMADASEAKEKFEEELERVRRALYDDFDEWCEDNNQTNSQGGLHAYFEAKGYGNGVWEFSNKEEIKSDKFVNFYYNNKSQAFLKDNYNLNGVINSWEKDNFITKFYQYSGYNSWQNHQTDEKNIEELQKEAFKKITGGKDENTIRDEYYHNQYGNDVDRNNLESKLTAKVYTDAGYGNCYQQWQDVNTITQNILNKYYSDRGYTGEEDIINQYYAKNGYTNENDIITKYYLNNGGSSELEKVVLSAQEKEEIKQQADKECQAKINQFGEFIEKDKDASVKGYAKEFYKIENWDDYKKKFEEQSITVAAKLNEIKTYSNYASEVEKVLSKLEEDYVYKVIIGKVNISDKEKESAKGVYEDLLKQKLDAALEYKRTYLQSAINYTMYQSQQYKYDYDYIRQYALDSNGRFITHRDNSTWNYECAYGDGNYYSNITVAGGYELTTNIYNPLATNEGAIYMGSNEYANGKIYEHNYTFRKSCLNLAYNRQEDASGKVTLSPYNDEYIFAGWMVDEDNDGVLKYIDELKDDDIKNLPLYTAWYVREFESNIITLKTYSKDEYVKVDFNGTGAAGTKWTIYVPGEIASNHNMIHHPEYHNCKNQLTMCTSVSTSLTFYDTSKGYQPYEVTYVDEVSAWDFDFDVNRYNTIEKLNQVVPKLMPDTDYRAKAYNATLKKDEKTGEEYIEYQPYNVQVITITPEELNKMVYYDYAKNSGNAEYYDGTNPLYHSSERFTNFINNVDFVLFSAGSSGNNYYFKENAVRNFSHNNLQNKGADGTERAPVLTRVPELCSVKDGKLQLDPKKYVTSGTFSNFDFDLEWQVAYGIYRRTGDTDQKRRVAVIMNESLGDQIGGMAGNATQIVSLDGQEHGTKSNLVKLYLMYFAYTDPTRLYDYYVNPEYTISDGAYTYRFDKMKGTERDEEYLGTCFTGTLYDYTTWNLALFFPFELYGENHWSILTENSQNDRFSIYNYTNDQAWPIIDGVKKEAKAIGKIAYDSVGLMAYPVSKNIANPYIFTYNGDSGIYGEFFDHKLVNIKNMSNSQPSPSLSGVKTWVGDINGDLVKSTGITEGNRYQAFEYFISVGRADEIKDGKIAVKSAVEFMVQGAMNGKVNEPTKGISILNALPVKKQFTFNYPTGPLTLHVPNVMAEDIGSEYANVNYRYEGYTTRGSVLVAEYYWTYQYKNVDFEIGQLNQDWSLGAVWYNRYTGDTVSPEDRWYKMPDSSSDANRDNYFKTYLGIDVESPVADANGNNKIHVPADTEVSPKNFITKYTNENPVDYYTNMLLKPSIQNKLLSNISGTGATIASSKPTYIIVVKEYGSYEDYENNASPISIIMHNVTLSKFSHLFYLD